MFALRVTYLTGRVYSSLFDDGDVKLQPEWPPHPSRLFSALVSAWGDGGAEQELISALQWLEQQDPPVIYADTYISRTLVQAFVPVNDVVTLPEDRPRKPRAFPSASLSHPQVYFAWKDAPPPRIAMALDQILRRTSSLGHSASLVAVEITDAVPSRKWTVWCPNAPEGIRMRIPHRGRLEELIQNYQRFQSGSNKIHRPSLGRTTLYAPPTPKQAALPQGVFDRMIVLRRDTGPRTSLRSTLSLAAALRGAIQSVSPQPVPECLSGHAPGSTPEKPIRSERPHVAVVPLPFVDAPHATSELMGLAVLLPKTLTQAESDICWQVLTEIEELRTVWGKWRVSITDADEHRRTLRPETWTLPRRIWSTVTPFVFDRYPKDPFGPEADQVVRQAFRDVALPEPAEISLHYNPWHTGVPKSSAFPPAAARANKPQRYHCHVWVRFDRPIAGPVVAGAGRYYGYGLFHSLRRGAERP